MNNDRRSRFRGSLLAGAAADALGAPIEFLKRPQILARYGASGLRDFVQAFDRKGAITDDTQMTLFTAEGLLRAHLRSEDRGICNPMAVMTYAYLRWLITQNEEPQVHMAPDNAGMLLKIPELHERRVPGHTCLEALKEIADVSGEAAVNNSKGCGGVMRVAPVGLFFCQRSGVDAERTFEIGVQSAALTHGHPTGFLSAGVFAGLVGLLAHGDTLPAAVDIILPILKRHTGHEETQSALTNAIELAQDRKPSIDDVEKLGQGWVAEEALAIAVYCAAVAPSLEEGIILAVNHSGDSDSTGSMAGNLLGAIYGKQAIPNRWLKDLELAELIGRVADDLCDYENWTEEQIGNMMVTYPPN